MGKVACGKLDTVGDLNPALFFIDFLHRQAGFRRLFAAADA
jgi:hypothetical protein